MPKHSMSPTDDRSQPNQIKQLILMLVLFFYLTERPVSFYVIELVINGNMESIDIISLIITEHNNSACDTIFYLLSL